MSSRSKTGFSPSVMPHSKGTYTWREPQTCLSKVQLETRSLRSHPDFNPELFPLHSLLLGESLLVSFPPLNNMLKFSGYSCLISDLKGENYSVHHQIEGTKYLDTTQFDMKGHRVARKRAPRRACLQCFLAAASFQKEKQEFCSFFLWLVMKGRSEFLPIDLKSNKTSLLRGVTNSETGMVRRELPPAGPQGAFKGLMIHRVLRFTRRIAFCCVLHRCRSQDIHCQKLSFNCISFHHKFEFQTSKDLQNQ